MAKQTTFAISYRDDYEIRVQATTDGFGSFKTPEAAAERIVEICDVRIESLRASKAAAKKILRKALKGQQHDK